MKLYFPIGVFFLFVFATCRQVNNRIPDLIITPDPSAMLVPDSLRYLLPILDSVWYRDQLYRHHLNSGTDKEQKKKNEEFKKVQELVTEWDKKNMQIIDTIIAKHGWLGPRQVGLRGVLALFLPIQHSDLKTQEKYLPLIRQAAIEKKIMASSYAMLADRVEIKNKRPQIYGTQINFNKGAPELLPLLNPDSVDAWRRRINMAEPLDQYLKRWNLNWDKEVYKSQLPQLRKKYGITGMNN